MDIEELEERLSKALDGDNEILVIAIAQQMVGKTSNPDSLLHYARAIKSHNRFGEASKIFNKLLSNCADNCTPWLLCDLADMKMERGNIKEALKLYIRATRINPDEATFPIYAGTAAFRLGKFKMAEKLARYATKCKKGCTDEAWYNLGGYLTVQLAYEEAIECFKKAIEIDPDYGEAKTRLECLKQVIDFEKEIGVYGQ